MTTTISLADLTGRGILLSPSEAVAIVQLLIQADSTAVETRLAPVRPSCATIRLSSHGSVVCVGCAARLSINEAAQLLRELLPPGRQPVPGGLQYAIARALHEVSSPSFDSLDEFSRVIGRYQQGSSRDLVRALVVRARRPVRDSRIERRRSSPSVAELRRQLREADRDRYELRAALRHNQTEHRPSPIWSIGQAPVAAGLIAGLTLLGAGHLMGPGTSGAAERIELAEQREFVAPREPGGSLPPALDYVAPPQGAWLTAVSGPAVMSVAAREQEIIDEPRPNVVRPVERTRASAPARASAARESTSRDHAAAAPSAAPTQEATASGPTLPKPSADVALPDEPAPRHETRAGAATGDTRAKKAEKKGSFERRVLARIRFEW